MANSQVTTRDTQLEKQRIGFLQLTLTNFASTSEPAIAAGSVVEVGGSLYVFSGDEAITGWSGVSNETDAYIKLVPGVGLMTAEFVEAAPTWSDSKQGWYNGIDRYVAGLHRGAGAGDYEDKWVYQRSQDNNAGHRFYGDGTVDIDAGIKGNLPVGGYFEMNGVALKYKVFEIGDWNMLGGGTVEPAHGITPSKIRWVEALIRDDADTLCYPINFHSGAGATAGRWRLRAGTKILELTAFGGGSFDNTNFNATGYNRGWVAIWYEG